MRASLPLLLLTTLLVAMPSSMLAKEGAEAAHHANVPVPAVDLARYTGLWYEIAHLPMHFQRKCVGNTTARYMTQQDGTITVRNRCQTEDGSYQQVDGEARRVGESTSQLEVRFAPGWLSWLPMVWGDYWIIALDKDYQWAVVGNKKADNLWILSRTPTMDEALRKQLLTRAQHMGYPVEKIELTSQDGTLAENAAKPGNN